MHPQRPYEGYAYPTEFQSGAGVQADSYFSPSRSPPPSALSAAGGAVGSTGLTRRSPQHTGSGANIAAAAANANASPTGGGPVSVAFNTASPSNNTNQYPGSYGYFHGHGNSIDVNSGYNSDAGSSVSNPRYFPHGNGAGIGGQEAAATDISPTRPPPPQPPRFGGPRHASAVSGAINADGPTSTNLGSGASSGGGNGGVFQPGGGDVRRGSAGESTRSGESTRPPVAPPPTFLPSRPFVQTPPLTAASPLGGHGHAPHPQHQQQQQPYMVPMPPAASSFQSGGRHGGGDPLGGATPLDISAAAPRMPHMVSPSTAGPRMPAASSDYGQSYGAPTSGGGGGGGGGFFSRMVAQVIPTFDDGNAGVVAAGEVGGVPRERPPHQLRFGNPEDDLPLLEELGIFPRHIVDKARAVLNPFRTMSVDAAKDTDLAGPILFALSLALLLSLRGKIQFSAIYGLFVLGVAFFKVLLSLMQPKGGGAPLQFVVSTVGYALLPTVLLAVVRTTCSWLLTRRSLLPLTLLMILWSAWCGSVLVAKGLGMQEQRYLVLYPMVLFYAAFDALTVF